MALSLAELKDHCNVTGAADDALLTRLLSVATRMAESEIGYRLTDTDALPEGAPADLGHAVYMIAAHLYENREATLIGLTGMALPLGASAILANFRTYTFGLPCVEADDA